MSNPECGHWVPTKGCRVCGPENFGRPQPPPDGAGRAEFEAALLATLEPGVTVSLKRDRAGDYVARYARSCYALWQAARSRPAAPAAEPVAWANSMMLKPGFRSMVVTERYEDCTCPEPLYRHPAPPQAEKE